MVLGSCTWQEKAPSHPGIPASICQVNQTVHFLLVTKISVCHHPSRATVNTEISQSSSACPGFSSASSDLHCPPCQCDSAYSRHLPTEWGEIPSSGHQSQVSCSWTCLDVPVDGTCTNKDTSTNMELQDSGDSGGLLRDIGAAWESRRCSCPWQGLE